MNERLVINAVDCITSPPALYQMEMFNEKHQRATAILALNAKRASNTGSLIKLSKDFLCIHSIARREEKIFAIFPRQARAGNNLCCCRYLCLFCAADEVKNRIHSKTRFMKRLWQAPSRFYVQLRFDQYSYLIATMIIFRTAGTETSS